MCSNSILDFHRRGSLEYSPTRSFRFFLLGLTVSCDEFHQSAWNEDSSSTSSVQARKVNMKIAAICSLLVALDAVPGTVSGFAPLRFNAAFLRECRPRRIRVTTRLRAASGHNPVPASRNQLTSDPELLQECPSRLRTAPLAPSLEHVESGSCSSSPVETSLLPSSPDGSDNSVYVFPLLVTPKKYTSNFCLRAFMEANREWIDKAILKYGAVLFRGFDINSAKEVEADVRAFEPNLSNEYRGTSPRIAQKGSEYVFSAAEVPSHFPIAQHLEMSFLPAPPRRLFFSALQAPTGNKGGETALTDFRKVYRDIPAKLRDKLASKKIRYTRKHKEKGFKPPFVTTDITSLKGWSDLFDTHNKTEVEEICRRENLPVRWEGRNRDTFVSEYNDEPFQLHPDTKEPVWFNHAQVFHWSTFPAELLSAFRRTRDVRFLLRSVSAFCLSFLTYAVLRRRMALHVSYGDGRPISFREMGQIRKAIHRNMVFNQWQKGDLLMIDNFSTSHGREPTYSRNRKIVVAWSNPLQKSNDPVYGSLNGDT